MPEESNLQDKLKEIYFRLTEQKNDGGLVDWDALGVANEIIQVFESEGWAKVKLAKSIRVPYMDKDGSIHHMEYFLGQEFYNRFVSSLSPKHWSGNKLLQTYALEAAKKAADIA